MWSISHLASVILLVVAFVDVPAAVTPAISTDFSSPESQHFGRGDETSFCLFSAESTKYTSSTRHLPERGACSFRDYLHALSLRETEVGSVTGCQNIFDGRSGPLRLRGGAKEGVIVDTGNLCAFDPNVEWPSDKAPSKDFICRHAQFAVQQLLTKLVALPDADSGGAERAVRLPSGWELLPCVFEQHQKRDTKWKKFAQSKGIEKRSKRNRIWDEGSQKYVLRWRKPRATDKVEGEPEREVEEVDNSKNNKMGKRKKKQMKKIKRLRGATRDKTDKKVSALAVRSGIGKSRKPNKRLKRQVDRR